MKAAIYAHYSSEAQRESSIEDQVRLCRDEAHDLEVIYMRRFAGTVPLIVLPLIATRTSVFRRRGIRVSASGFMAGVHSSSTAT